MTSPIARDAAERGVLQLDYPILRAIILAVSFRGDDMQRCQAAMLMIGLRGLDWDAGMIPGEICNGDQHLAGMACASLRAQGLIEGVGRVKSSNPLANGRKVNLWRVPAHKVSTARTWLDRHGYVSGVEEQASLAI